MRRSVLAFALLLAAAPVTSATEVAPNATPEMRAVEVAAPTIRKHVSVAPAKSQARSSRSSRAAQFSQRDLTLIAVVLLVVLVAIAI